MIGRMFCVSPSVHVFEGFSERGNKFREIRKREVDSRGVMHCVKILLFERTGSLV